MNITFLGATKTVTGSNFLVEGAGKKFLVDCGLFQGNAQTELENEEDFMYDVHDIDFMLLTHAHTTDSASDECIPFFTYFEKVNEYINFTNALL